MVEDVGIIEPDKEHVREQSYSLPAGFEWDTIDLGDNVQVCKLLVCFAICKVCAESHLMFLLNGPRLVLSRVQ